MTGDNQLFKNICSPFRPDRTYATIFINKSLNCEVEYAGAVAPQ